MEWGEGGTLDSRSETTEVRKMHRNSHGHEMKIQYISILEILGKYSRTSELVVGMWWVRMGAVGRSSWLDAGRAWVWHGWGCRLQGCGNAGGWLSVRLDG